MKALRRILALAMAAILAASPASACDALCPEHSGNYRAEIEQNAATASSGHSGMAMTGHKGCAEDPGSAPMQSASHEPDCAGSADCAVAKSLKKQALAATAAIAVDAPAVVILTGPLAEIEDDLTLMRRRPAPPAAGPPVAPTPVSLKNILRI
jgi:hypothetical protein